MTVRKNVRLPSRRKPQRAAKRLANGDYEYRGHRIQRQADGMWGCAPSWDEGGKFSTFHHTMRAAQLEVDRHIAALETGL